MVNKTSQTHLNNTPVSLTHSNHDNGKIFVRQAWKGRDLAFSWNVERQRYGYVIAEQRVGPYGVEHVLKFKTPYNNENAHYGMSMVGPSVLSQTDLVCVATGVKEDGIMPKEKKMERDVNYIGTDYGVVEISFDLMAPPIKTYVFKTSLKGIMKNDLLVVETSDGLKLVKAESDYIPKTLETKTIKKFNKAKAWVVNRVDTEIHETRIASTERKKFLLAQLAERKEAMEEVAIYKILAASDPDAAKLLEELEGLK